MRLKRLYLKNYANILNAMGRSELEIDFSKCRNKVVIIKSENGSGKSSIINELHPYFSMPIVWLEDVEIVKSIEFFLDDGTILSITYYGWKAKNTRPKPSKGYIHRIYPDHTVDLNPNGNMTSAKEIISDLLDINDDYMALSAISANSKGIGAMKPAERKRFIALIISSISPFIKMHKIMSTKYSTLKSMITTINAKLSQLGDVEVIKASLDKNIHELKILERKKDELIQRSSSIKAQIDMMCKDGSPTERYTNLINQKKRLEMDILGIPEESRQFDEMELKQAEKDQVRVETKLESIDSQLRDITDREKKIRDSLESDTIKLRSLFDPALLDDTKTRLEKAEKDLAMYTSCFDRLGFKAYNDISEAEYTIAINAIERYNDTIASLGNQFSTYQIETAVEYISKEQEITDYHKLIDALTEKLNTVSKQIEDQLEYKKDSEGYNRIPKDCNHKQDCPFVNDIVKAANLLLPDDEMDKLNHGKDKILQSIEDAKKLLHDQEQTLYCIYQIRDLVKYVESISSILLKFPNTEKIRNSRMIISSISKLRSLPIDISSYKEFTNYITLITAAKKDITSLREKLAALTNQNKESWSLQNSIESKTEELRTITDSKSGLLATFKKLKDQENALKALIQSLTIAKASKEQYEAFSEEMHDINDKLKTVMEELEKYQSLEAKSTSISTELNNLNMISMPELKNNIEQAKYQMILYDQYRKDYTEYSALFKRLEEVRQATSVNGIQASIMDITMNEILSVVNQLAAMMFGGRFVLNGFDINEDNFLISFLDQETGKVRPDISMMSASQLGQLSMIISFVLLYNASKKFNIIRLDEVDNNLDNDNRLRFFNLVYTIMQILNFDQAVIISHNTELDLSACDLIITRIQNVEMYNSLLNSGANIIANFME